MAGEPRIEVSLSGWMDRIENKIDHITESLDRKADRQRVHTVENNVAAIHLRLERLEGSTIKREGPLVERFAALDLAVHDLTQDQKRTQRNLRFWFPLGITVLVSTVNVLINILLAH